jgi:3-dehydroquinate dehydratase/shikimate dehydrogenase
MTRLCVPIFVTDLAKGRRDIAAAAGAGADMVELRIDKLRDQSVTGLLLADRILPAIVTCRRIDEGGYSPLDNSDRADLLANAIQRGAANVDLELKSIEAKRQLPSSNLIVSYHDFQTKPSNLVETVQQMGAVPAAVNKIVWKAQTIDENLDALRLIATAKRPTVAVCMGEAGLISRILAKKFGAFLSFAALGDDSGTAPGQIKIKDVKNLYRWDSIQSRTKVYGVVAFPVGHSMSPAIHNASFDATGHDGVYLPMLVQPEYASFKSFLEKFLAFPGMDLAGLSVTIPHKENALRFLKEKGATIEPLAERIGAVNTIIIRQNENAAPVLSGRNTDYAAILDSITAELKIDRAGLVGRRVSILGAGGTGRAAVAALAHYGAQIAIANRTHGRAQALAEEFGTATAKVTAVLVDDLFRRECDIFINATSIGMAPRSDQNPLEGKRPPFNGHTLVFDLIYNPMKTRLLTQAEGLGARTISGVEMFCRQAAVQFESWTSIPAPIGVMRRVISDRLGLPLHSR